MIPRRINVFLCFLNQFKRISTMKIYILVFLMLTNVTLSQNADEIVDRMNRLCNEKQYFQLRRELENHGQTIDELYQRYFGAIVRNAFNKPGFSNIAINHLLLEDKDKLSDSMTARLIECKITNCVNLFEYANASDATDLLVSKYNGVYDKEYVEELKNSGLIWKAASLLSPQTVSVNADTRMKVKKDIAGLSNIDILINGKTEQFIFDTGANFSTVSESYAQKLGLKFLDGKIKVGTVTGIKVDSKLAYAESLTVGNLICSNVLFLVLPDESLTFGGGVYVINGILGFPVIKEMKEIHLTDEELFVPKIPEVAAVSNLSFDGFTPLVETIVNSDTLVFVFDTGAKSTILYYPYYKKNKSFIEANYTQEDIEFGGAGGQVRVRGYKLSDLNFNVSGSVKKLNGIPLLSKVMKPSDEYSFGNLGRDFTGSFKLMIMNFERMYVGFKN